VLLDFLGHPRQDQRRLLKLMVLDAEFCTFHQKWRLLRQLLELYEESLNLNADEMKTLRKELQEMIGLRNRFAHGNIWVRGTDMSVWIEYVENGKQFEPLDEEALTAAKEKCDRAHAALWKIHEAIAELGYKLPGLSDSPEEANE
jgi:hypothetical protein